MDVHAEGQGVCARADGTACITIQVQPPPPRGALGGARWTSLPPAAALRDALERDLASALAPTQQRIVASALTELKPLTVPCESAAHGLLRRDMFVDPRRCVRRRAALRAPGDGLLLRK